MLTTNILEQVEQGTKFTFLGEFELPYGMFGKAFSGIFGIIAKKDFERALEKLKSILEK
jgi:hypothetical protein